MFNSGITLRSYREDIGLSQAKLAEAAGVPQHVLSSFELGKSEIPDNIAESILGILRDNEQVEKLVTRKKRYTGHVYDVVEACAKRARRYTPSVNNGQYLEEISSINDVPKYDFSAISLFSGCGGLSLGFRSAGFKVKGFLEKDDKLSKIYADNFPDSQRIGSDISLLSDEEIKACKARIGEVDVIIGGPPCQGFSLAGKRKSDDPRNQLFRDYMRFIKVFRPKIAVMENVRVLTSMKVPDGRLFKDVIRSLFEENGYNAEIFQLNATNYGVPQSRERVVFIAIRNDVGAQPSHPVITHTGADQLSFSDACSDLPYIESGEKSDDPMHCAVAHPSHVIKWLWDVPEGRSAHENEDSALRPPSGYNTTYKRQVWREPGATVQTTFGMISGCRNVHPIATRSLTVREAARLQSFPDDYVFCGSLGTIRTGIGNAVPPLLARAIARHIRSFL